MVFGRDLVFSWMRTDRRLHACGNDDIRLESEILNRYFEGSEKTADGFMLRYSRLDGLHCHLPVTRAQERNYFLS